MKNTLRKKALLSILILLISYSGLKAQAFDIKVHYLGHASFILDFRDFKTLTDFGKSYCWGYNSPIYGIGDYIPAILTISHYHLDHYDPDRIPQGIPMILDEMDSLSIMQLHISPVRTCETTPGVESNTSFIFDYMGFKICHLGDAQAEIMNIEDSAQQVLILDKFPEQIDLLFMTIEGVHSFIPEAELFIDLLQPGIVIPIHYWSPEYKEDFLSYLELQNDTAGRDYEVIRSEGPLLEVNPSDTIHDHIRVIGLEPYPYGETGLRDKTNSPEEICIYPNPCPGQVNISFHCPADEVISYRLFDVLGKQVSNIRSHACKSGMNTISLDMSFLTEGIYIVQLKSLNLGLRNKYVIRRSK